jgi:hypothetical protein
MSLRNKLTILSITLMSLMTIPTLAENAPVTSRIENANFDVEIKTPEGWSQVNDFTSIPEIFKDDDQVFQGIQFKNGSGLNSCVILFAEESQDDDEDVNLFEALATAQEFAFPGSTLSKVTLDGSFTADYKTKVAKASAKGTIEGSITNETGEIKTTITGTVQADTTKGNFAVGSGTLSAEGAMPLSGTTGVLLNDGYQLIVTIWGTDAETQVKDAYRFLEAIRVTKKAPVETAVEVVAPSEPVAEETSDRVIVTESVVLIDTVVVIEPVVVVEVVEETPVVATEASA